MDITLWDAPEGFVPHQVKFSSRRVARGSAAARRAGDDVLRGRELESEGGTTARAVTVDPDPPIHGVDQGTGDGQTDA